MTSPRQIFGQQIASLIKDLVGDGTLKEIFEQPENHEAFIKENEAGTPSGIIALKLGIIDADTKTALLVAQAGERMMRRAEAIQDLATGRTAGVESSLSIPDDHKDFAYVGSERDPKILQEAQASWQISQMMLNRTMKASAHNDNEAMHELTRATAGFQNIAASYMNEAADKLEEKGFADAAQKARDAAVEIAAVPLGQGQNTPHDYAEKMRKDAVVKSRDTRKPSDLEAIELPQKLSVLTQGQKSAGAVAEVKATASGPKAQM